MGTRHLIAVFVEGEYRVAQYGQWDGCPSGVGRRVLKFLRDDDRREALRVGALTTRYATPDQLQGLMRAEHVIPGPSDLADWRAEWPQLSRDCSADVLGLVAKKHGLLLNNKIDFAGDSLFCEWAYVIDYDAKTLEVFKGFNKQPLDQSDRFFSAPRDARPDGSFSEYHQIKLVHSWPLDSLPKYGEFARALGERSEDEEDAA